MPNKVWLNDGLVDAAQAKVSISDAGLVHGAGLFETMASFNGRVFRLDRHIGRLLRSADRLGIGCRLDSNGLVGAVQSTIAGCGLEDARVRLTITGGSPPGDQGGPETPQGTVFVTATEFTAYPAEFYKEGMMAVVCPYRLSPSDPLWGHKTTNYLGRLMGLQRAQKAGGGEALWFTSEGLLAEGCISNIFLGQEEKVITPSLETPVLPGITRAAVLELAEEMGMDHAEGDLTIDHLLDADEVFLTNSIMGVMPVCRIEGKEISAGKPGPLSKRLGDAYRALVDRECRKDA